MISQKWNTYTDRFSRVTDRLGRPIDEDIFDTVVALNTLEIRTTASCEGHIKHGLPYPWVSVGMPTTFVRKDPPEVQQLIERLIELRCEQDKDSNMQQLREREDEKRLQPRYKLFAYLTKFY